MSMSPSGGPDVPVLALDGPSGSGKGAVGVKVAETLSWRYLDSGALYRIVGLLAKRQGITLDDTPSLAKLAGDITISMHLPGDGVVQILLDDKEISGAIRGETIGQAASQVAALPEVRESLITLQRAALKPPGLVADGRDMGTVIFPDALLKVYLTASVEVRAQRRYKQLIEKGFDVTLPQLRDAVERRDRRDKTRANSPLVAAKDAIVIDTSPLTLDEVITRVIDELEQRLAKSDYVTA